MWRNNQLQLVHNHDILPLQAVLPTYNTMLMWPPAKGLDYNRRILSVRQEPHDGGNYLPRHHAYLPVLCKETGNLLNYVQFLQHPQYADTWNRSYANEMGRLCQGVRTVDGGVGKIIKGTDTFHVFCFKDIPKDRLK